MVRRTVELDDWMNELNDLHQEARALSRFKPKTDADRAWVSNRLHVIQGKLDMYLSQLSRTTAVQF